MSNTTAATLAQNKTTLAGQELPSKRLNPDNGRMSVTKISHMRGHLSVEESRQLVKLVNTESPDDEVWLITEKGTDGQPVLLGIINQKREDETLEILPIQDQLQSLFDLVVLIATVISSDIIPEGSKFAYLHKDFLEALSNKQGGQGVVMVMQRFGFHVPDDNNPEHRGRLTSNSREGVLPVVDDLSQDLRKREKEYWQHVAANQQQRKQAA